MTTDSNFMKQLSFAIQHVIQTDRPRAADGTRIQFIDLEMPVYRQIAYWMERGAGRIYQRRRWVYLTYEQLIAQVGNMVGYRITRTKLSRALRNLQVLGLIEICNPRSAKRDWTNHYFAVEDKARTLLERLVNETDRAVDLGNDPFRAVVCSDTCSQ